MTDSDFNIIPAVESLSNVPGLTPTQPRQQRKRRPNRPPRPPTKDEPTDDVAEEEKQPLDRRTGHAIDYRA
jgi:hypothetical protein